jgi:hypothetical protein
VLNIEGNLNWVCFVIVFRFNSVRFLPKDMVQLMRVPVYFVFRHPVCVQLNFNPVNYAHPCGTYLYFIDVSLKSI